MGAIADIEHRLAELWRAQSRDDRPVVRACSHNLIVVCEDEAAELQPALERVARCCPGRVVVVQPGAAGTGLRTHVAALCVKEAGDALVCSEQIVLEAGSRALSLVPAAVLQLLVEEMPVWVYWRRKDLGGGVPIDELRDLADRLIVDSMSFAWPPERLAELQAIASTPGWEGSVVDLGWTRLDPWREAIATFFDAPRMRCWLARIRKLTIATGAPPGTRGAYLVGWLASRLQWDPGAVRVDWTQDRPFAPGELSSLRIEAEADGERLAFVVRRSAPGSRCVVATFEQQGSCTLARTIRLPDRDEGALLCEALQQQGRDEVFAAALAASTQWRVG